MMIRKMLLAAILTCLFSLQAAALDDPAIGSWHTIDDETGEVASRVTISVNENNQLIGVIAKILKEESGDGLCDKCPEPNTNKPIEGLQFMWGFTQDEEGSWQGGRLLDPETGDIYKGKLSVLDNPDELEVRGYIGISLFGRSQVWQRVSIENDAMAEEVIEPSETLEALSAESSKATAAE